MDSHIELDILQFFDSAPEELELYRRFHQALMERLPETKVQVQKSQITYKNRYNFGCASLPGRRIKNMPKHYLLITLGLARRLESPRAVQTVEPYPGRWTNHIAVTAPEDIDEELMAWVEEAWQFSMNKQRKPGTV